MSLDSNITVAIAGFLLSLSGVASMSGGDFIYIVSARRALQVQIGLLDWVGFLLWDVFYVFAVWTFVTVRGGQLSSRRYFGMAASGLVALFLGNGVKVFAQVYTIAQSGALSSATDVATFGSVDVTGFAVMLGLVGILVACTCAVIARARIRGREWPMAGTGLPKSLRG